MKYIKSETKKTKRYEDYKITDRFFTGCDVGDVAQGDVVVCFDCYMQSDGRLQIVGYRRVDPESAHLGAAGGPGLGEVEGSL